MSLIFSLPLSSASSRPWTSALAGRPAPYRRWPPVPSEVSEVRSSDQVLIGETLPCRAAGEAVEPVQRVALHVAFVEPERELVNVTVQVLVAGVMIDAVQPPLKH